MGDAPPGPTARRNGRRALPLVRPAEVLLACARDLGLLDLVVLTDAALHLGACSRSEIAGTAARRRAGAPLLRRALRLADGRSESPWESMLRMLHVTCDVEVVPQHQVLDDEGLLVARGDLWIGGPGCSTSTTEASISHGDANDRTSVADGGSGTWAG